VLGLLSFWCLWFFSAFKFYISCLFPIWDEGTPSTLTAKPVGKIYW